MDIGGKCESKESLISKGSKYRTKQNSKLTIVNGISHKRESYNSTRGSRESVLKRPHTQETMLWNQML